MNKKQLKTMWLGIGAIVWVLIGIVNSIATSSSYRMDDYLEPEGLWILAIIFVTAVLILKFKDKKQAGEDNCGSEGKRE